MTDNAEPIKLTTKQRRFVEEYCVSFNATQSAIAAGYSQKTANVIGSENLSKPYIKAEIDRFLAEKLMTVEEALILLAQQARGDIGDFMDIESMSFDISMKTAKEKGITHLIKKVKQRTSVHIAKSESDEDREVHEIEIELHDPQTALDKILRAHGVYASRLAVTDEGGGALLAPLVSAIEKIYGASNPTDETPPGDAE